MVSLQNKYSFAIKNSLTLCVPEYKIGALFTIHIFSVSMTALKTSINDWNLKHSY